MYNLKCYDWLCHKFTMDHNFSKISTNSISLNHKGCSRYGHKAISIGDEILLVGGTN